MLLSNSCPQLRWLETGCGNSNPGLCQRCHGDLPALGGHGSRSGVDVGSEVRMEIHFITHPLFQLTIKIKRTNKIHRGYDYHMAAQCYKFYFSVVKTNMLFTQENKIHILKPPSSSSTELNKKQCCCLV